MNANPRKTATSKTTAKSRASASVKPQRKPSATSSSNPTISESVPLVEISAEADKNSATNSKQAQLLAMLQSTQGVTIEQMMEATGWQAHSIRGCISAVFRKKMGLTVERITLGTAHVYRVAA